MCISTRGCGCYKGVYLFPFVAVVCRLACILLTVLTFVSTLPMTARQMLLWWRMTCNCRSFSRYGRSDLFGNACVCVLSNETKSYEFLIYACLLLQVLFICLCGNLQSKCNCMGTPNRYAHEYTKWRFRWPQVHSLLCSLRM